MIASWPCPVPGGATAEEFALAFMAGRARRVLVVPALFDESNRLRRLTVEVMRRLDAAGVDAVLPDLPGCNESLQALEAVSLADWRAGVAAAAAHFGASHVLALRGGVLACEGLRESLPVLAYAPVAGASVLRQMMRMRVLAAREAGREETAAGLLEQGMAGGIELAGYRLSAAMVGQLQAAVPGAARVIAQGDIGGAGLWLRAEPGEDAGQAEALAARVLAECGA
jgi:hypothetical protein